MDQPAVDKIKEIEMNIDGYSVKIIFAEDMGQSDNNSMARHIRRLLLSFYIAL